MTKDPYRLFFPLGWLLAFLGVGRMVSAGAANPGPKGLLFHSAVMIEGFVAAYAFGFLFTFIPRRTKTPPPAGWQLAAPALALVASAVAGLLEREALGHALWLAGTAVVIGFALRRLAATGAVRKVPPAFAWVPASLLGGATGAALILASRLFPPSSGPRLWAMGRGLLLQGLVPGLAVGVGALLIPQLTRTEPPPAEFTGRRARWALAGHALLAAAFLASFPLEVLWNDRDDRAALALRGVAVLTALVAAAGIHRPPTTAGTHRRLLWLSAWLLPLGWILAALFPKLRGPALHVSFVGGFALMIFAVSLHVVRSHGGSPEPLGRAWRGARWMGGLAVGALAVRVLGVGLFPEHGPALLGVAAALLVGALAVWLALSTRALLPPRA